MKKFPIYIARAVGSAAERALREFGTAMFCSNNSELPLHSISQDTV